MLVAFEGKMLELLVGILSAWMVHLALRDNATPRWTVDSKAKMSLLPAHHCMLYKVERVWTA